jgi:flagellar biosynthesis protein FlhG
MSSRDRIPPRGSNTQASGLRALQGGNAAQSRPVQVIAVTGGKGGVGKTSVAVNLATALSQAGRRVMLLDGDLGLANVDIMLGLATRNTLAQVIAGERTLEEIIVEAPQGFSVVPGASGAAQLANLSATAHLAIVQVFSTLSNALDHLIVDTAAGIAHGVLQFSQAAQQVLVVVSEEPASITDAYSLIKVLSREHGVGRFRVLVNMSRAPGDGALVFQKLERVASRFLDVVLDFVGEIPDDPYFRRAVREQRPVLQAYPSSTSALALKKFAALADKWPVACSPRGNLEFFLERLVQRPAPRLEIVR